ncbi:MAG: hypothetical protein JRN09_05180 [Nitrososphaerota archaeon]|nr:hypothetical protein [Nitrososphaerota archaeon]
MLTRRRNRLGRRPGISSLIGAIFFVLVVFLVFSSTVLIFEQFTNYAVTFKQVGQQDQANKATSLGFSGFSFGGNMTHSTNETIQAAPATGVSSLAPIQNMNFTNSMSGWTFSRAYELSLHTGEVTNYPKNVLPGLEVYTLTVYNNDPTSGPLAEPSYITGVQISVSPSFVVPASLQESPTGWDTANPGGLPIVTGTTITWTANSCSGGIPNTASLVFDWTAVAPPTTGSYFHTVTITWQANPCTPIKQQGLTPIQTSVVTSSPGGVDKAFIEPVPSGTIPGGAFGGYDGTSTVGSDSGPGSLYITYAPSINGQPLTSGKQLTAKLNFTSDFTLGSALLLSPGCCTLSLGYALDNLVSNSSQVLLSAYLTDLSAPSQVKEILNNTIVNELNGQNVSKTGWQMNNVHFSVSDKNIESVPGQLDAGLYELTLTVTATLFGANAPSADYPAAMLMHFDDVGLALQESGTGSASFCADTASVAPAPCASSCTSDTALGTVAVPCELSLSAGIPKTGGVEPQQVQSMKVDVQVSALVPGVMTTAYAYIEDIGASSSAPSWVELGQVSFASSATISATIPASSAPQYLSEATDACYPRPPTGPAVGAGSVCLRVYEIQQPKAPDVSTPVDINASLSVQTWQPDEGVVYLLNNGTAPVHLVSIDVKGPSDTYSNFDLSSWVSPGQTDALLLGQQSSSALPSFIWGTGQTYVVTVVTDKGITLTGTFVSP